MRQAVSDEKVKEGIRRSKRKVSNSLPASGDTRRIATPLHELIHKVPSQEKAEQILKPTNSIPQEGCGLIQLEEGIFVRKGHGKLNKWNRRHDIAGGTIGKCPQPKGWGCIGVIHNNLYPNRENDFVQVVYFEK